jgi:hypothetical protein
MRRSKVLDTGILRKVKKTARPRWHIGIRSRAGKWQEVMREVYHALQSLSFKWKTIDPFKVRAMCLLPTHSDQHVMVKFDLQLYQLDYQNFLLDFSLVQDTMDAFSVFPFFTVCSNLMTELAGASITQ